MGLGCVSAGQPTAPMTHHRSKRGVKSRSLSGSALRSAPIGHSKHKVFEAASSVSRSLWPVALITLLPVALSTRLWETVWRGGRPRAWDGTGHYALAQLYDQTIFPDTFGWIHTYFAGIPFPNFYPPCFYWCVAFLHHTRLVSFEAAFKIVIALPVLLLPAAMWIVARAVSEKSRVVAAGAALASIPLLLDYRFNLTGLSYHSSFLIGLYTQSLGFMLLALWYSVYFRARRPPLEFALACLLLALTVLTNFFDALTAALFAAATIINDVVKHRCTSDCAERKEAQRALIPHLIVPLVAACLTLFWVVPMLCTYDYFVTRPYGVPLRELIPPALWGWYAISFIGLVYWLRRPTQAMWPFLAVCLALAGGVVFGSAISPRWFPLQAPRFLSTLNFLLAVPVGHVMAVAYDRLALATSEPRLSRAGLATAIGIGLLLGAFWFIQKPSYRWAFHATDDNERIDGVLRFAQQHRAGRYLVEVPNFSYAAAALDSRGLNSYLGSQGNEVLSVVFREAAPNAIFFNPLVTAFSAFSDNFGISSVLADDLDFVEQPLVRHLERARFAGVKYLVIVSPQIKNRLVREPGVKVVYDSPSAWTIFELQGELMPRVQVLKFRPALVVSGFSLKLRRRNEYDFVRLAEEQFADGWFDVLLARASKLKIDRIGELNQFGALVLDTYECDDENLAFARLRDFAQDRLLILLPADFALYRRIRASLAEFPKAEVIERSREGPGEWVESTAPGFHYRSNEVRRVWKAIRDALDRQKVATALPAPLLRGEVEQNAIFIDLARLAPTHRLPVLIQTAYHPNWRTEDGSPLYAATPFFMLTFTGGPTHLVYERGWLDRVGLLASAVTLFTLCGYTAWRLHARSLPALKSQG